MSETYRVYFLNGAGHVIDAAALECDSDDQAVELAESQGGQRPWELWTLTRRVHTREGLTDAG
jgi:hypothetical protein